MNFVKDKTATAIALFLMFAMAFSLVALPAANAHTPPWTKDTWAYVVVTPNPIGVNEEALVVFWLDVLPQTASGAYGDRYTWTVEVTTPGGSTETLGPFTSDPVGGGWTTYTPDQVGTYTFVAKFPGITYTGANPPPGGFNPSYGSYINDTLLASDSEPVELTVQEEPIKPFEATPLPTDYWTRPINAEDREWYTIAGNWLGDGMLPNNFNPYTTAPGTAHIVWTKPIAFGGLAGISDISYYTGSAYEQMWYQTPIIIGGRLYYNVLTPPRYGWYCVDLRTGEEIWFQNSTGPLLRGSESVRGHIGPTEIPWQYPELTFGQVYDYESPNQHGAVAYLWSTYPDVNGTTYTYTMRNGTTFSFNAPPGNRKWDMYDAFSGNYICSIANVPSSGALYAASSLVVGSDGSKLIYVYDQSNGWLALWNSSKALEFPNNNLEVPYSTYESAEAYYWMWRPPLGRTVDGNNGYSWNVTAPKNLGSIQLVFAEDRIVGSSGLGSFDYGTNRYSTWALSVKPDTRGQLLWKKDYTQPPVNNATMILRRSPASLEDGIFLMRLKETRQWYAYSLDSGEKVWGPTASQTAMDMYGMGGNFAYGKLYSIGYGGILYCYDAETGALLWNSTLNPVGLEAAYQYWPVGSGAGVSIADHKVYVTTNEHSVTQPIYRQWSVYCFDSETGKNLWNITALMPLIAIADGYAVSLDGMDNQIYCFGKGQTATTVTASPKVSVHGDDVLIEGTVSDQSPGAKDTPAIADEYISEWMEYLYHQRSKPADAKGVEVVLETLDPNGNFYEIGRATSDAGGMYSYAFTPEVPGVYTIIATFEGSGSYFSSVAETAINVEEVPQVSPTPTPPPSIADIYVVPGIVGIIIAIVVVGLVIILMLRKR